MMKNDEDRYFGAMKPWMNRLSLQGKVALGSLGSIGPSKSEHKAAEKSLRNTS